MTDTKPHRQRYAVPDDWVHRHWLDHCLDVVARIDPARRDKWLEWADRARDTLEQIIEDMAAYAAGRNHLPEGPPIPHDPTQGGPSLHDHAKP